MAVLTWQMLLILSEVTIVGKQLLTHLRICKVRFSTTQQRISLR